MFLYKNNFLNIEIVDRIFRLTSGLPDAASEEAASWVAPDNDRTVVIDASTAFRVADGWTYGFPGKFSSPCAAVFIVRFICCGNCIVSFLILLLSAASFLSSRS
jgi:hypothetical protein